MHNMLRAIRRVFYVHPNVNVIYPIHMDPVVCKAADEELGDCEQVHIIEPIEVFDCHNFDARCHLCLTDSDGIQEACTSYGKPVLVLRYTIERPEGVDAGTLKLVGTSEETIYEWFTKLLDDEAEYAKMAHVTNHYGDGHACERIADILEKDIQRFKGDEQMKDIHWLVNRLKSMNAPEVAWRVQQKLLQKQEQKSVYSLHLPVTQIPLSKEMQGLRADADRIPFNSQNDNTSVFETLDIFGQFDYQLYKKKWNAGFQTENTWPEKDFSAGISIGQREDIGDIRINWELNRHFQFTCLAKNYYLTGKKEYLNELVDLFEDWNNHNLFLHGTEWTSAMELGIRVNSWIYTYVFLAHAYEKYQEKKVLLDKLVHGILVMTEYIIKHRAKFSSANNHLIIEIFAVGMAGVLFGKKEWIKLAVGILSEELPMQNYEDGVNKEMSLHYQGFVMEAYGLLWLALAKNKYEIPRIWEQYLIHISEYMADCCGDFGEVVVFGDNDEGKLLDLQGKIEDYYRYVLQLMGMLLNQRYTDLPLVENISWITTKEQQELYNKKKLYESKLVAHYKKGGYTVLRSRDHKVLIGMDHAELGFGSIAAHGHADALSIQAFYEGKPVLVDSGTYNYHVPKSVRNKIRSAKAHNTVYVEGIEQAEMLGPFLWGKRYKVENVVAKKKEGCVEIDATISYSDITHRRKITFDFERKLIVEDFVDGAEKAVQVWHTTNETADMVDFQIVNNSTFDDGQYSESYCQIAEVKVIEIFGVEAKTVIKFK